MRIESLIDRYFAGLTSCKEERALRRFFAQGQVPEQLEVYRPFFAGIEQEAQAHQHPADRQPGTHRRSHRLLYYTLTGIAAAMLLLTGIAGIVKYRQAALPANYVIIDGKRYTDAKLIREKALDAFREVQTDTDELEALSTIQ
ncbi:MAG: hypothetical protein LBL97_06485 [Prevotellaceae bacterium]|jgi:hypothetical protein|nr:hypothetical protein [Prevotellaceae bacterium]